MNTSFIHYRDVRPGMVVETDQDFSCLTPGVYTVQEADDGYYIECKEGKHYLDAQIDPNGVLVGIYRPTESA